MSDLTGRVVLIEEPFSEAMRVSHVFAVCAECAPGLADVGEEVRPDHSGIGGATQCCICGRQSTKGDGLYSTMRHATPVFDWVWVGTPNGGHRDVRPRGEVTERWDGLRR